MKRNTIIAAALAVAGAGVATYFIRKNRSSNSMPEAGNSPASKSHHITNAFSKAKSRAVNV
ncbi:hypothetical protein [Aridibaculum aurantiacum]|uniref:hypothetical protein n=1 Tax=Aridibaculum aurantiacum TaxID=2810307 RepID=UPI001A97C084|nr:hypothetical protein [Aridibaculum aurantiacum]